MKKIVPIILLVCLQYGDALAQNSSQWRGPFRNGYYPGEQLLQSWPEEGPELLWYADSIGEGYSAAIAGDGMVFITGLMDSLEVLSAFDIKGNILWQVSIGNGWTHSFPGTRSSVYYEDGKVHAINGTGEIFCLDAKTGKEIWYLGAFTNFDGRRTMWGTCESPLVVDDKLIYTPAGPGTTMVALNKDTGETIWTSESLNDSTAYVSPLLIEHGNRKIIASILANHFFGVDAENGEILWKYDYTSLKWKQDHWYSPIINVNTPVYNDGQIFISKGYDHKSAMFSLNEDGSDIELMWTDTILDVHLGGMILHEGYIYGSNWIHNRAGNWCCIDWNTGELMYETEWFNKGALILADGKLICVDEQHGNVGLVEPTPQGFNVISSFRVEMGRGPYWAHPVVSDGILLLRHGKYLMAYDIGDRTIMQ